MPYPAAYARWRRAEALLMAGAPHEACGRRCVRRTRRQLLWAPNRSSIEIEGLARRGRLSLRTDAATRIAAEPPSPLARLGLTARGGKRFSPWWRPGRTNRQIAETLFVGPQRPPHCTSRTSSASWASLIGWRRPRSLTGLASCHRRPEEKASLNRYRSSCRPCRRRTTWRRTG